VQKVELLRQKQEVSSLEDQIALNKGIIKQQARQGLSTEKIYNRSSELLERHEGFTNSRQLKDDVQSGKFGSRKEEEAKWNQAANNVRLAQAALNDADAKNDGTKEAIENLTKFNKALVESNDALKKQEDIVKAVTEKERKRNDIIVGAASGAASLFNSIMAVGVDHDTQQTRNRTAWANTGNAIWDRSRDAVQNLNIESAMSIMDMPRVNEETRRAHQNATAAGTLARASAATADAAQGIGGAGTWFADTGGQTQKALVASGHIAEMGSDQLRGLTTSDKSMNEYNAQLAKGEAGRHMLATQAQEFVNHQMGSYNVTRGAGSTSDIEAMLMSSTNINAYAKLGISADDARDAAGVLSKAGSMKRGQANQIIMGAGSAELSGGMSRSEYISAAARITSAGGEAKDMEAIMRSAVTAGMDNSKNIQQMVDATLNLSKTMESTGISGVEAAKDMVGARVEDLVSQGYDRNLATSKAMSSIDAYDRGQTDRTVSFGNIVEQNEIRSIKGGQNLTQAQMNNIIGLSSVQMQAIKKGGKEGRQIATQLGLSDFFFDENGVRGDVVQDVNQAKIRKTITNLSQGAEHVDAIVKKKGKDLTPEEMAVLNQGGKNLSDEIRMTLTGKDPAPSDPNRKTPPMSEGGQVRIQQATQKAMNVDVGAVAVKAMGGLSKVLEDVIKVVDPKTFGAEIHKAAASFTPAAVKIENATGELLKSVKAIQQMNEANINAMGKNVSFRPTANKVSSKDKEADDKLRSMGKTFTGP
jgi:hypothetical protein